MEENGLPTKCESNKSLDSQALPSVRLSDNEISAILSLPMDMVTDDRVGGGGSGCPDDEATRRALLHMSKVRACADAGGLLRPLPLFLS